MIISYLYTHILNPADVIVFWQWLNIVILTV